MDYKNKYLKYKQKYLALKEQDSFVQSDKIKEKYLALKDNLDLKNQIGGAFELGNLVVGMRSSFIEDHDIGIIKKIKINEYSGYTEHTLNLINNDGTFKKPDAFGYLPTYVTSDLYNLPPEIVLPEKIKIGNPLFISEEESNKANYKEIYELFKTYKLKKEIELINRKLEESNRQKIKCNNQLTNHKIKEKIFNHILKNNDLNDININGKIFSLKYTYFNGRTHVIYSCNGQLNQAYLSLSEGLWRYKGNDYGYEKGYDYITTTQLHIDLQCFINSKYLSLPDIYSLEEVEKNRIFESITYNNSIIQKFYDIRNNDYDVFIPLDIVFRARKDALDPITKNERFLITKYAFYYFQNLNYAKNLFMEKNIYNLKLTELFDISERELKLKNQYDWSGDLSIKDIQNKINIEICSKYMEYFFNRISEPVFICKLLIDTPYDTDLITSQIINFNVYKITIQLKTTGMNFFVYYGVFNYKNFNYVTKEILPEENSYKMILNIVAADSDITIEGLSDCYIATGIYVYKAFAYDTEEINREEKFRVSRDYFFIGDLLTNMWPLPTLVEPAPPA